jgi:hypothetical protein
MQNNLNSQDSPSTQNDSISLKNENQYSYIKNFEKQKIAPSIKRLIEEQRMGLNS